MNILLTKPKQTTFFTADGTVSALHDGAVTIREDGTVCLTANQTGLLKLRFSYDAEELCDLYQYGDAFERGYGDLEWSHNRRTVFWYTAFTDKTVTYGFGVKTCPNAICCWDYDGKTLSVTFDIRNGTQPLFLGGNTLEIATLIQGEYEGPVQAAMHAFCRAMCPNPRLPKVPIYGGNDWYCCYANNSFEKIMTHTKMIVECAPDTDNRPYMVIDDGWELCRDGSTGGSIYLGGPWEANMMFGDMKKTADAIWAEGAIPGIWFRPLLTLERLPEEWILRRDDLLKTLDPSHPDVLNKVAEDVKKFVGWGYRLIKHDFTTFEIFRNWFFELPEDMYHDPVTFHDKTKTTAQIIKAFYQTIRDAAGEDVLIIGCNTVSHLSAGFFELQRTGDDTSGKEWERTKKMGVNTLAMRMPQHNAFYAADADCTGITNAVAWERNCQWLDVLSKSGTPLFVSIAEDAYSDEVKAAVTTAFARAAFPHNVSEPQDMFDNLTPTVWKSDFGTDTYDWDKTI